MQIIVCAHCVLLFLLTLVLCLVLAWVCVCWNLKCVFLELPYLQWTKREYNRYSFSLLTLFIYSRIRLNWFLFMILPLVVSRELPKSRGPAKIRGAQSSGRQLLWVLPSIVSWLFCRCVLLKKSKAISNLGNVIYHSSMWNVGHTLHVEIFWTQFYFVADEFIL